jgi:hypothetical protein
MVRVGVRKYDVPGQLTNMIISCIALRSLRLT